MVNKIMCIIGTIWYIFASIVLEIIILIKVITTVGDFGYKTLWKIEAGKWLKKENPETGELVPVIYIYGEDGWWKNLKSWILELWKK